MMDDPTQIKEELALAIFVATDSVLSPLPPVEPDEWTHDAWSRVADAAVTYLDAQQVRS